MQHILQNIQSNNGQMGSQSQVSDSNSQGCSKQAQNQNISPNSRINLPNLGHTNTSSISNNSIPSQNGNSLDSGNGNVQKSDSPRDFSFNETFIKLEEGQGDGSTSSRNLEVLKSALKNMVNNKME